MSEKDENILVGTSGYVFPDWAKRFYPAGLAREHWLRYYIRHFRALELNTSFYAIPSRSSMEKMASQLPESFNLHIKLPRTVTHESRTADLKEMRIQLEKLQASILPLQEKGVVKGYLAQFPVSFRPDENNLKLLRHILHILPRPLYIEFRNNMWQSIETENMLANGDAKWVIPDAPDLPKLMRNHPILLGDTGYIRLHGRNKRDWYANDRDRYNYSYPDNELDMILKISRELFNKGAGKVFVYFNNCHHGQAAANAKKFAQLIGLLPPDRNLL